MQGQIRRVVTGHDKNGKAIVISDGPAPFIHRNPMNEGWYSTDIWRTNETPALIVPRAAEPTLGPRRQLPTKNGTVIRINEFPPETADVARMSKEQSRDFFARLGNESGATFAKGGRHPMMHRTETIDYAIILSGEIYMLLDEQDVHLRAGDVVVQCGTNHAWSNRFDKPCFVAFVLIDGKFDPQVRFNT